MKEQSEQDNPWSNLTTITKFDRGNNKMAIIKDNITEIQGNKQLISSAIPSILIESLIKQICTMFEGDSIKRNKLYFSIRDRLHKLGLIDTSYDAIGMENICGQYQHALYNLVTIARAATGCEPSLNVPSCMIDEWSRYRREFQEKEFIAAGGFSNVYKALHRLDGIEYAVKKIIVRFGQMNTIKQHLEEVQILAKLNHANIVPYKTAWIEPTLIATFVPSLPNVENKDNKSQISKRRTKIISSRRSYKINRSNINDNSRSITDNSLSNENNGHGISLRSNKEVSHIIGQRIIELSNEDSSDIVSFRNDSKDDKFNSSITDNSRSNVNSTDITNSTDDSSSINSNNKLSRYDSQQLDHRFATLYIQMALCDKTLQQWLKERDDPISQMTITTIFTQILQGVNHIHSIGMVHHDIKPSNIFITAHFQIQLGDFGLACPLQKKNHNSIIGTRLYAAPEQLKGECNPKSDMYSIGVVLLELLIQSKTQMELCLTIEELKKGQIPPLLAENYSKWVQIISQLIDNDPNERPSTNKLLLNLTEDKDTIIAQLKDNIIEKDKTIRKLEEDIAELRAYITKLEPL